MRHVFAVLVVGSIAVVSLPRTGAGLDDLVVDNAAQTAPPASVIKLRREDIFPQQKKDVRIAPETTTPATREGEVPRIYERGGKYVLETTIAVKSSRRPIAIASPSRAALIVAENESGASQTRGASPSPMIVPVWQQSQLAASPITSQARPGDALVMQVSAPPVAATSASGYPDSSYAPRVAVAQPNSYAGQSTDNATSGEMATRLAHMRQAIAHLQEAGLHDEARRAQAQFDAEVNKLIQRLTKAEAELAVLTHPESSKQQVLLKVNMLELDLSMLRKQKTAIPQTLLKGGVLNASESKDLTRWIDNSRKSNAVKILGEPNLITSMGRPAFFNSGGEFPLSPPQGIGKIPPEYKKYGMQVDFVPIVLGNGDIRLEVRPRLSEINPAHGLKINGINMPALTVLECDTGMTMKAGQTLILGGCKQSKVVTTDSEATDKKPSSNAQQREKVHDTLQLIAVQPYLVDPLEPPPGFHTNENSDPTEGHSSH